MQFGVNILNYGPGARPDTLLRWARISAALGYHSVMISDHVAVTPSVSQRYPEPFWDCFTTLSWLAGQTPSIRLGTTVTVLPYRHPIQMARLVANIDQLSGGRFIFGTGVGNAEDEFKVLGVPLNRRGLIADESLAIMLALWNSPAPVSFKGKRFDIEGVSGIETAQKPHPPVWVGGASDGAILRAVKYGDAWHPILRAPVEQTELGKLKAVAEKEGKATPRFCPRMRLDLRDEPLQGERLPGTGSLQQVHEDLQKLEQMGAEHVLLDWYTGDLPATRDHERGWRMLALLADKVLDLKSEKVR